MVFWNGRGQRVTFQAACQDLGRWCRPCVGLSWGEYASGDQAQAALAFDNTLFHDHNIRVQIYEYAHIPASCNEVYNARKRATALEQDDNSKPRNSTGSGDLFKSDQTSIYVEPVGDKRFPPELVSWREAYAIDAKIPPAMKRYCKDHGIDKTAAVKILKQVDGDTRQEQYDMHEESPYRVFSERCELLFQKVCVRWQDELESDDGLACAASDQMLDQVYHDFVEKKTLLEFWRVQSDIHKLLKKQLPYDRQEADDQDYKIVKMEHWETLMKAQLEFQGAEEFRSWLSRVEDAFNNYIHD